MKGTYNRTTGHAILAMVLTVGLTGMVQSAEEATAFSITDNSGTAQVKEEGKAVTILYDIIKDTSTPSDPSTDILVGGSDPSNIFVGDLASRDLSGLRFRMVGDGHQPQAISLQIRRETADATYVWTYSDISISDVSADWTVMRVPLDPSKGWSRSHDISPRSTFEDTWTRDLSDVDIMLIQVQRNGNEYQSYSLADFSLVGEGPDAISEPAKLSLVEDYFGVASIDDIDRTLDSDGDGMTDYDELRAGLSPQDPNSVFMAQMQRNEQGNIVTWPGVLGASYAVMRSNDLRGSFTPIGQKRAGFTGTQEFIDENPLEDVPNFYKVVLQ